MKKKFSLSNEDASAAVSYMDSIKGALIWLAFIDNGDGSIRVRLRSRFITVSELAERYRGGGHACAAGATVYSKAEMKQLIAEADAMLKEYKEKNEGWL
jgi:phosphoesterase RecJ-like protein